jgi:arsenical pump membrane protein
MLTDAVSQAWPPFVLVAGLLLIGQAANADGVFEALGGRAARAALPPMGLLAVSLALVAVVTAVLNLDTSVVFLTPVLLHGARGRGLDERPFLYGALTMSNSASTLLPGSNLTNMIVTGPGSPSGARFAGDMLPAWLVACSLTALVVAAAFPPRRVGAARSARPEARFGPGAVAAVAAAVLMLALPNPAVPVLALGLAAVGARRRRPQVAAPWLLALFAATVALGTLARVHAAPWRAVAHLDAWASAAAGAAAAVAVNNLPAATLLSAHPPSHPDALLLGLDLGPNLAVTGSLSAILWMKAARSAGARPSLRTLSCLGAALVPITLAGALAALQISTG